MRRWLGTLSAAWLLGMSTAGAQSLKDLDAEMRALAMDAKYKEALVKAEALEEATRGEHDGNTARHAEALSWIAFFYEAMGDVRGATGYFERALTIYQTVLPPDHPDLATALNNLGFDRYRLGEYDEAETLYQRSLDIRERVLKPDDPAVADTLNNLGELFKAMGRIDETVPLLNRALEIRVRSLPANDPRIASSLQNLAGAMELDPKGDKFIAAQKLLERALAIRLKSQRPDHPEVAGLISKIATNLSHQGKYREAEARFQEALAARRKSQPPLHPDIASTLVGSALVHLQEKNLSVAQAELREAVEIRDQVLAQNSDSAAEAHRLLSRALYLDQRTEDSLAEMRRGTAMLVAHERQKEKAREHLAEHLHLLAEIADRNRDLLPELLDEAFQISQRASDNETAAAVATMASRFATQDTTLQGLVRERESIDSQLGALEKQFVDDLVRPPGQRHGDTKAKMAELEKRRVDIDAIVQRDFPYYFSLIKPTPVAAVEIGQVLNGDEALISLVTTPDETFVFAVTHERQAWQRVPVTAEWLEKAVKSLRLALDTEDLKKNVSSNGALFDLGLAYELYAKLLAPLEPAFNGKKHLILVPSGALTSLPFQVLVTKPPRLLKPAITELSVYGEADWLIREHALSMLPSVQSLKSLRGLPRHSDARKPMTGFGNPKLAHTIASASTGIGSTQIASLRTRGGSTISGKALKTRSLLNALEELPGTEQELRTIAKDVGADEADLHFGAAATESAVKSADLSKYKVIYFATHGLVADDIKGLTEPALVLSPPDEPTDADDGLLTASEISETLKLNADWVVLAACNTAAESKPGAEALSGLAKSFFHAGARALLVSHWRVDSEAAANLTTSTFRFQVANPGIGRAEALRQAMLTQVDSKPTDAAKLWNTYPAFWAAFSIVGEGGSDTP